MIVDLEATCWMRRVDPQRMEIIEIGSVLSTVAGSMISVTGITFSITIVTLTLASSQFGLRLLRNFMHDTGNQVVLGTFLATFV